jgi:CheY-like chemotaxis protein/nitrogen-specific signal transduction histidine kinase
MLRRVKAASAEREELLAREREASRLKDEFLAAVSHELRTPLNAIIGWVQILATTTANEQTVQRAIASIARNARAQTRVIEDLVDVSRIVTGKLNLRFAPVDLREVVDAAVDVTRSAAQAKNVSLTTSVVEGTCLVTGDRDRLQQIVWNLLSNAVKFTPEGGRVDVSLIADDDVFEVTVTDTGDGIPPAFLPHVFDRFRQADGSLTREHGGLGLGLAIAKELTELHGGSIQATSSGPGQGATFALRLPRLVGAHTAEAPRRETPTARARLIGVNILAVDDNEDALDVLAAALSAEGGRLRTAAGGEDAIRELGRDPAAVVLCDLAMPVLNGFQVLRWIRQQDTVRGQHTVAIALTAHASEEHRAESLKAGFDAHVAKPYDVSALVDAIAEMVSRRSPSC